MQIIRFHIITQKVPAKYYPLLKELRLEAGKIWSDSLNLFFNLLKKNGNTPNNSTRPLGGVNALKSQVQKAIKSSILHSQTTQAIQDRLFGALKSFFKNKKRNPNVKPPKPRKFYNLIWKNQAVRYQNGKLILPLARTTGIRLSIPLRKRKKEWLEELLRNGAEIRQAEIVFKAFEYRLILLVKETVEINPPDRNKVVALDLGEIHPFVSFDGKEVLIWNGRLLRSYKQLRLKLIALKQKLLAKKQKGSRRWKRIKRSFERQIAKVGRKIEDLEHKLTRAFVNYCKAKGIGTVVIGKVKGIREKAKYNKNANQKIHLMWRFGRLLQKLKYKLEGEGIVVVEEDERYTTQLCPVCGNKYKPKDRNYICPKCGFSYHRDGVGAINLFKRFMEKVSGRLILPVGGLTRPQGVSYSLSSSGWVLPTLRNPLL
ncbi:MAG: IS200/IS605 family element transposase accessory protein TnpB [Aquificae bacterium]|nr:IS200/IS605 family element transposase accessory protein TnpB [Aquificota bacterium]